MAQNVISLGGPVKPGVLSPTFDYVPGPTITAAATISVTSSKHMVTGTTTIQTINPPYVGFDGEVILQALSILTLSTSGNILAASTVSAGNHIRLVYDSNTGFWYPGSGSGGGSTLPTGAFPEVIGYDGAGHIIAEQITYDMIGPAFAVNISGPGTPVEAGTAIVNPQFSVSYNQTPVSASFNDGSGPLTISPATLTTLGYGGAANTFPAHTYNDPGSLNAVQDWTYAATNSSGVTRTATWGVTWWRRTWFDMVNIPGTYNAAFILGLTSTRIQPGFANSYAIPSGDGVKFGHICLPTGWGSPSVFKEHVSQLPVAWTKVASGISVTHNGATYLVDVWRAPVANTAAFTFDVS